MNTTLNPIHSLRGMTPLGARMAAVGITRGVALTEAEMHHTLGLLDNMPEAVAHRRMLAVLMMLPIRGLMLDPRSMFVVWAIVDAMSASATQDIDPKIEKLYLTQAGQALDAARQSDEIQAIMRGYPKIKHTGPFFAAQAAHDMARGKSLDTFKSVTQAIRSHDPADVVEDNIQSLCNQMNAYVVMLLAT